MQATDLKFPGDYTHGKTIRREVAHVISQLEIAAANSTVPADFSAFLADAAAKTPGYTGPVLPATQAVISNGVKLSGWTVTGTGTFFTPTIVAGVCTGGVLSAS